MEHKIPTVAFNSIYLANLGSFLGRLLLDNIADDIGAMGDDSEPARV